MYCVYLTEYKGDKFPKYYVGSSSLKKVESGYRGSVHSKQYRELWETELELNPHLFVTSILSVHQTRKEALAAEYEFQLKNNVVKSSDYLNKSFAQPNGFFGMDVSGENNPMYGSCRTGEKHKGGENISKALQEFFNSDKSANHRKVSSDRLKINNPSKNPNTVAKQKETWKKIDRNVGEKNGMFGKQSPCKGKKLYNNGSKTKAFPEGAQPEGWVEGRHKS